ncbi:MAG: aconitate hydratase, partial [Planctomycetes bacterium]|nr:aconitate hydratase [Planctomycetota bacterium]
SVLSGNRNFEGRVHQNVRSNFLASPPLVVAYALAGNMHVDVTKDALGTDRDGKPVYLKDLWPTGAEIDAAVSACVQAEMFQRSYGNVFHGSDSWRGLDVPAGSTFAWDPKSTYVKNPPYFDDMEADAPPIGDVRAARVLLKLGDSVTTDHISPAAVFPEDSPAGQYLKAQGVAPEDFNSYGARRGNHEVMMRGTFANVRLRNQLAPGTEGGWTRHQPSGDQMTVFDAAMRYKEEGTPLVVLAGKEYGTGSSRDWAAKGPCLLGVKVVIAESYERIHRSNLIGMGILPLQFEEGANADSLGLDGTETYEFVGLEAKIETGFAVGNKVLVRATDASGKTKEFQAISRIDTPNEVQYYKHGGILRYVLRRLAAGVA